MKSKIIGYTCGAFDLFHVGHLNILRRAKAQCDQLIVGVTTDEIILATKHKTPVIPYKQRYQIVKAIKYVDLVVKQDNLDKIKAHDRYKYTILFVGNDWQGDSRWVGYEKELATRGARIEYLPYTAGVSSTILRQYIGQL